MARGALAVVIGYLAIAGWVMLTMTLAWSALGADFAFQPGGTHTTTGWALVSLVLGFTGAILGGAVTRLLSRSATGKSVRVLAGILLVLGLIMAGMHLLADDPERVAMTEEGISMEEMSAFEASSEAIQPAWYNFAIAVVGFVGVLIGGRQKAEPETA